MCDVALTIVCISSDYDPITIQSYQGFCETEVTAESDRIISPEWAMKETSLALSEHMNLEAMSEELVYIPSYTNT